MLPLAIDDPLRQPDFAIPRLLVKVTFLDSFEPAWTLVHHIVDGTYITEVKEIAANAVDPDVANHQHSQVAFALSLCPHQPSENVGIFRIGFNDCHMCRIPRFLPFFVIGDALHG